MYFILKGVQRKSIWRLSFSVYSVSDSLKRVAVHLQLRPTEVIVVLIWKEVEEDLKTQEYEFAE